MKGMKRLGLMAGIAGVAAIFSYLCIPGHVLGTLFYNSAPPLFRSTVAYGQQNSTEYWTEVKNHVTATLIAVGIATAVCVPMGILASKIPAVRWPAMNLIGAARGVPGIAVLFLMLPLVGAGEKPAIIALTVLASAPIFLNTAAAYAAVDRAVIESARGMGMNRLQILTRIETPLAAPIMVAGLRTATVEVIASATIAAFINYDTLGYQINIAVEYFSTPLGQQALVLGVGTIATLALLAELSLTVVQRLATPPSA